MATLRIEYSFADRKLRTAEFEWGDGEEWVAKAKEFFGREHDAHGWPMYLTGMDVDGQNRRADGGGMLPAVRGFMEWWCRLGRDGGHPSGVRRYFCDEHGSMWISRDGGETWDALYAVNDCRCSPPGQRQPSERPGHAEKEMTVRVWLGPERLG